MEKPAKDRTSYLFAGKLRNAKTPSRTYCIKKLPILSIGQKSHMVSAQGTGVFPPLERIRAESNASLVHAKNKKTPAHEESAPLRDAFFFTRFKSQYSLSGRGKALFFVRRGINARRDGFWTYTDRPKLNIYAAVHDTNRYGAAEKPKISPPKRIGAISVFVAAPNKDA